MLAYPVFLALQLLFTIGVALLLAVGTAFFRDVRHLVDVALAVLFWATPVVYETGAAARRLAVFDPARAAVALRHRVSRRLLLPALAIARDLGPRRGLYAVCHGRRWTLADDAQGRSADRADLMVTQPARFPRGLPGSGPSSVFAAGGLVRRVAIRAGAVVPPRPDRWHRMPTPTFGGIGDRGRVRRLPPLWRHVCLPAGGSDARGLSPRSSSIGWYDDVAPMSALAKMVNSLAMAAFFVLTLATFKSTAAHAALTMVAIVWFGGVTNAVNLLDNMDGLAAGVTAIAAAAMALTFPGNSGRWLRSCRSRSRARWSDSLAGTVTRRKLFMGNCGSLAIGGLVAASALTAVARAGTVDVSGGRGAHPDRPTRRHGLRRAAAAARRPEHDARERRSHVAPAWWRPGSPRSAAVGLLYAVGALGAGAGYRLHVYGASAWPFAAVVAVSVLMMALYLARLPAYAGQDFQALHAAPFAPLLADITFRWHAGEVLLDLVLIATWYYAAYRRQVRGRSAGDIPARLLTCRCPRSWAASSRRCMSPACIPGCGIRSASTMCRPCCAASRPGAVLSVLAVTYLYKFERFSRGVFLIDAVLLTAAICRDPIVLSDDRAHRGAKQPARNPRGDLRRRDARPAARPRDARESPFRAESGGIRRRQPAIRARRIVGVPVRGSLEDLGAMIPRLRIEEVAIELTDASPPAREARVREICAAHGVAVRRLHMDIV